MQTLITILIIILILSNIALFFYIANKDKSKDNDKNHTKELADMERRLREEFKLSRDEMRISQKEAREELTKSVEGLKETTAKSLDNIAKGNEEKLEKMRETVDEKLQASVEKRFNESFKNISTQLEQVHKGLGEMQTLATGVGDLKKVMEGTKTRGVYGEVLLKNIIEDIFTKDQYEENIRIKKGSDDAVEFAIKFPGKEEGAELLLPIDSKFLIENYSRLIEAYEKGDKKEIIRLQKALETDVKTQAKKISEKYIDVPRTTEFGVLFLPTESLYAEVAKIHGLTNKIQHDYHVTITGPTTLTALLNSLLLGFKTLAIEKSSSKVWETLGAVKTQFGKFGATLEAVEKKLTESANKIGEVKHRSVQLEKSLKQVEALPEKEADKLLGA